MKQINFFHWYNGQSPLAYCCMQIHPEQFWDNVKDVCICGRTERPRWVIEARRKIENRIRVEQNAENAGYGNDTEAYLDRND